MQLQGWLIINVHDGIWSDVALNACNYNYVSYYNNLNLNKKTAESVFDL